VAEIEQFARKLAAHARERISIVLYDAAPQSLTYPLWKRVLGVKRLPLPSYQAVSTWARAIPKVKD